MLKPKPTHVYFGYNELTSNFKYGNIASAFTVAVSWILNCDIKII